MKPRYRRLAAAFAFFGYWLDKLADEHGEPPMPTEAPTDRLRLLDQQTVDDAIRLALLMAQRHHRSDQTP